jgi:hypothetical protein
LNSYEKLDEVINIAQIIIKITERSYNLLKRYASGGSFKRSSKFKDGYYYIKIDKNIYDKLKMMDDDLDKAIFYSIINKELRNNTKLQ